MEKMLIIIEALKNREEELIDEVIDSERALVDFVDENGYIAPIFIQQHCYIVVELEKVRDLIDFYDKVT